MCFCIVHKTSKRICTKQSSTMLWRLEFSGRHTVQQSYHPLRTLTLFRNAHFSTVILYFQFISFSPHLLPLEQEYERNTRAEEGSLEDECAVQVHRRIGFGRSAKSTLYQHECHGEQTSPGMIMG